MTQMATDRDPLSATPDQRDPQTYAIIGAAMEVHKELGAGFLEPVYQDALSIELTHAGVQFEREVELGIQYKGGQLRRTYRADFVCCDEIIVELKAIKSLTDVDRAQLLNYLRATKLKRGLLINFGSARLEYKRMVL